MSSSEESSDNPQRESLEQLLNIRNCVECLEKYPDESPKHHDKLCSKNEMICECVLGTYYHNILLRAAKVYDNTFYVFVPEYLLCLSYGNKAHYVETGNRFRVVDHLSNTDEHQTFFVGYKFFKSLYHEHKIKIFEREGYNIDLYGVNKEGVDALKKIIARFEN